MSDHELNKLLDPVEPDIPAAPVLDDVKDEHKGMGKKMIVQWTIVGSVVLFIGYSLISWMMAPDAPKNTGQTGVGIGQTDTTSKVDTPTGAVYNTATNTEYKTVASEALASAAAGQGVYTKPVENFDEKAASSAFAEPVKDPYAYAPAPTADVSYNMDSPTPDTPVVKEVAVDENGVPIKPYNARVAFLTQMASNATTTVVSGSAAGVDVDVSQPSTEEVNTASTLNTTYSAPPVAAPQELISTGDMFIGETTTSLNSLVPQTPVRAVGVGGRFNNAIYMGYAESVADKYMVLVFTTMSYRGKTYPISAIAIHPRHSGAEFADHVESKAFSRNAMLAGLAFGKALGAAKATEGSVVQDNTVTNASTTTSKKFSTGDLAVIGLGGAAGVLEPELQAYIRAMKPEIKVYSNQEVGILFLKPMVQR